MFFWGAGAARWSVSSTGSGGWSVSGRDGATRSKLVTCAACLLAYEPARNNAPSAGRRPNTHIAGWPVSVDRCQAGNTLCSRYRVCVLDHRPDPPRPKEPRPECGSADAGGRRGTEDMHEPSCGYIAAGPGHASAVRQRPYNAGGMLRASPCALPSPRLPVHRCGGGASRYGSSRRARVAQLTRYCRSSSARSTWRSKPRFGFAGLCLSTHTRQATHVYPPSTRTTPT